MNRGWVWLVVVFVVAGTSCQDPGVAQRAHQAQETCKQTSIDYLTELAANPETSVPSLGIRDGHLFGFPTVKVKEQEPGDPPAAFEATVQFWCKGTAEDGEVIQQERSATLTLRHDAVNATYSVADCQVTPGVPLTFWGQAATWFLRSWALPLGIFCIGFWIACMLSDTSATLAAIALVGGLIAAGVTALIYPGYAAYKVFDDSILAAVLAVPAFLVLSLTLVGFYVGMLRAVAADLKRRRGTDPKWVNGVLVWSAIAVVLLGFCFMGGL